MPNRQNLTEIGQFYESEPGRTKNYSFKKIKIWITKKKENDLYLYYVFNHVTVSMK